MKGEVYIRADIEEDQVGPQERRAVRVTASWFGCRPLFVGGRARDLTGRARNRKRTPTTSRTSPTMASGSSRGISGGYSCATGGALLG
jgi:hypothetical protein